MAVTAHFYSPSSTPSAYFALELCFPFHDGLHTSPLRQFQRKQVKRTKACLEQKRQEKLQEKAASGKISRFC